MLILAKGLGKIFAIFILKQYTQFLNEIQTHFYNTLC